MQALAVALATVAVGVLMLGLGLFPWLSLVLATTFGLYGPIKKRLPADPVVSVTAECLLLVPPAVVWLAIAQAQGQGAWGRDGETDLLLAMSGLLTALPLVLFSYAS
ncbi:hypothetical protein [Pseudoprimorskyibacter insulae]|uniref:Uncharacterized protein n=1 Tax=Pseudoprimorskyibacter insulae TaxID=1695997 RepID=A0A2R8AYF2_9RHOB|nr:hypothetical protein [Pseudoprimorskyibacter insulae]SPF80894.1 hypothetical protein PRI8871_02707 [Pseudoprimorskyibacter insulae]